MKTQLTTFPRDEFVAERFDYRPGEHVTLLGPTGSGKTTLAYQLLGAAGGPRLPGVVLVMKPRDSTVTRHTKALGYRRVRAWPPLPSVWQPKPPGFVVWPKATFDFDRDDDQMYRVFRATILDSYKRGNRILFADEVMGICQELGLEHETIRVWTRGRSMGLGLWAATQKPSHIPLHAYSQAQHLFLHYDPDKRNRDRFDEIGGFADPGEVKKLVLGLRQHQWLYIKRHPFAMCIVDA